MLVLSLSSSMQLVSFYSSSNYEVKTKKMIGDLGCDM